jgi:hypothetical protein
MADTDGHGHEDTDTRTWFERNAIAASILLLGVPFLLRGLLRSLGASDTVAELTQIVVGAGALIAVAVVIVRSRR